jgi:hypothetical protein
MVNMKKDIIQKSRTWGVTLLTRKMLEEYRKAGTQLVIQVVGLLIIDKDVNKELARATIQSLDVTGMIMGWESII